MMGVPPAPWSDPSAIEKGGQGFCHFIHGKVSDPLWRFLKFLPVFNCCHLPKFLHSDSCVLPNGYKYSIFIKAVVVWKESPGAAGGRGSAASGTRVPVRSTDQTARPARMGPPSLSLRGRWLRATSLWASPLRWASPACPSLSCLR